jgi:integrase
MTFYCGLRWGEATALKRRDIDLDRARIKVNSSVERVGQHYRLGPTKTHEKARGTDPPARARPHRAIRTRPPCIPWL